MSDQHRPNHKPLQTLKVIADRHLDGDCQDMALEAFVQAIKQAKR